MYVGNRLFGLWRLSANEDLKKTKYNGRRIALIMGVYDKNSKQRINKGFWY